MRIRRIDAGNPADDARLAQLRAWLGGIDQMAGARVEPASADASFRRYFRVHSGNGSFIAMDAPPDREDCSPFVRISTYLDAMGLNAARIIEANVEEGFLLLSDLGSTDYLTRLKEAPESAPQLYGDAIDALLRLQERGTEYQGVLPPYDATLLAEEMSLFHDWLCKLHLGVVLSATEELAWRNACTLLIRNALDQPKVFVHRDYHSRNLMVTPEHNPGILDFQDAVEGPMTYDLVSLLRDCYIRLPDADIEAYVSSFHSKLPPALKNRVSLDLFTRSFDLMGVQRHLKAAGIFARLWHRDGKAGYLEDVPRVLEYLSDVLAQYPELQFLSELVDDRVRPALEKRRQIPGL